MSLFYIMCYANIFKMYIFWGFVDKFAECVILYQCYDLDSSWEILIEDKATTNIWCDNKCKAAELNYRFSGTISKYCYCQTAVPKKKGSRTPSNCTEQCPGNHSEICGGYLNTHDFYITVSEIDRPPSTVAAITYIITPIPVRQFTTTAFMKMISTDTSPATVTYITPLNTRKSSTSTSANTHTSTSTDLTETITHTSKEKRPRKLLCKCSKRLINTKWHTLDGMNITDAEVKTMIVEDFNKNIKPEISVNKNIVSKEVRKKNSSVNQKNSSQSIGRSCIVFLVLPMGFLIGIDILNCCNHFRKCLDGRRQNQIRPTSKTQNQTDSYKPLQENVNATGSYYGSRFGNNFHPDEFKRATYQKKGRQLSAKQK